MISAIVLAAGQSTRMGDRNKLLLPLRNKTIIENTVDQICESHPDEVIVITGHEAGHIGDLLEKRNVRIIFNPDYKNGLTSSIQAGVKKANGGGFMLCLSDMVAITAVEYKFIQNEFRQQYAKDQLCICVPRWQGQRGNPVTFSSHYRNQILSHESPDGCKEIIQQNRKHVHWVDMPTDHILKDIDSFEEYRILNQK